MTSFLVHYCWFVLFLVVSLFFLVVSLYVRLTSSSFLISIDIFSSWFIKIRVSVSIDIFSSWFSFVVTFIRSIIIIYSFFYMSPYSKTNYFIWLTVFFVLSMLIVINIRDFFFIMLGWDGLGLVSFFLIVYYQNYSSIYSGLFTVLINRVGDCFFIVSISFFLFMSPYMWSSSTLLPKFLLFLVVLTFMTKSAIYPFSPWLPLAIAAPTPISALVHSSTLVTAGLYLSMRFSFLLYSCPSLITFFLVVSVFTSFYAGMNAIFETDIKKLIALSTLSHLGFIGMAFSCGLLYLSFFHLIIHALFKSVLFMSIGDIITNLFHAQDIRFLSSGYYYTPFSFYIMAVSLLNLLGIPTIRGYFSKDLVLETCNFSYISFFIVFVIFLNVFFTYYYTYRLFYFSFSSVKFTPFTLVHSATITHVFIMTLIRIIGVVFGSIWINYVVPTIIHVSVPLVWKLTPYVINFCVLLFLFINLKLFNIKIQGVSYFFSNIMFLSCVIITLMSNLFVYISFYSCKASEYGLFNFTLNSGLYQVSSSIAGFVYKIFSVNSLYMIFVSRFIFLAFIYL